MKIVNGRLGEVHQVDDLVVATRWVHEILVLKGRDNPELGRRIDDLLAQIGETKVDYFYEQEVKALGDHCALPLTRYIQSDRSHRDEKKRVRAAQILSDIASRGASGTDRSADRRRWKSARVRREGVAAAAGQS